ncbi:hypothetical protein JTB14_011894 [Gonioctena quinquepunctata]|nr:hypothetical protein JTB14_011894 [Gonioctena quinquepunctata]
MVIGDLNISAYADYLVDGQKNAHITSVLNFCNLIDLDQYNTIENSNDRILDLTFSNSKCTVNPTPDILVNEDAHHPSLLIIFDAWEEKCNRVNVNDFNYNFRRADLVKLYQNIANEDWIFLNDISDANSAFEQFYAKIYSIIITQAPQGKVNQKSYPPWSPGNIIKCIRLEPTAWNQFKNTNPLSYEEFSSLRRRLTYNIEKSHTQYCQGIERNINNDSKLIWQYVKNKRSYHSLPNVYFDDPRSIANAFADFVRESYFPINANNSSPP